MNEEDFHRIISDFFQVNTSGDMATLRGLIAESPVKHRSISPLIKRGNECAFNVMLDGAAIVLKKKEDGKFAIAVADLNLGDGDLEDTDLFKDTLIKIIKKLEEVGLKEILPKGGY